MTRRFLECYLSQVVQRLVSGLLVSCLIGACDAPPSDRGATTGDSTRALDHAALPRVALWATEPGASASTLHFSQPGAATEPPAIARIEHAPDGEVRGALLPSGGRAVVVADMERRRDPSFGAWLVLVDPGHDNRVLATGCAHASRPWVLPSGRVLVQRGVPGPEVAPANAQAGELRTDALSVDEIDPQSGALRPLHQYSGYITHIAGILEGEVLLYRVAHQLADLVAVNLDSGALRVLAQPIPAHARDFSVDQTSRSVVFANLDPTGWHVDRLFVASGQRQTVARAGGMWVTPSVWPNGSVLVNDGRGGVAIGGRGPSRALGPGFDEVSSVSPDGRHVALLHRVPSGFARAFVTDVDGDAVLDVPAPPGRRLSVAGFLP